MANSTADNAEVVRRLQHMLAAHSNDPQWYIYQISQLLRRMDEVPTALRWDDDHTTVMLTSVPK